LAVKRRLALVNANIVIVALQPLTLDRSFNEASSHREHRRSIIDRNSRLGPGANIPAR